MATNKQDELDYLANRVAKGTMPGNARYIFSKTDWEEFKAALAQHTKEAVERAEKLWDLLDEIDTLSDMMKPATPAEHEALWRRAVMITEKRHAILKSDGYTLKPVAAPTASPQQGGQKDE